MKRKNIQAKMKIHQRINKTALFFQNPSGEKEGQDSAGTDISRVATSLCSKTGSTKRGPDMFKEKNVGPFLTIG